MAPPPTHNSAVSPCFHGCLAFIPRHFPPQSPPLHPLDPPLHSQQQPSPWDCSTVPNLQLPTAVPFRGLASLSGGMYGCGKDCLIFTPFKVPQVSCFTLSLCVPHLTQLPPFGNWTAALVAPPAKGRVSSTNTPVFSPSSFILPNFAWLYIFFSSGQVFLSILSWCSACTSVSEGVFLRYPWREDVLHVHLLLHHLVLCPAAFLHRLCFTSLCLLFLEGNGSIPGFYNHIQYIGQLHLTHHVPEGLFNLLMCMTRE